MEKKRLCVSCNNELSEDRFYRTGTQYYKIRCKLCEINNVPLPSKERVKEVKFYNKHGYFENEVDDIKYDMEYLFRTDKEDFIQTYIFLRDVMGYDIEKDIHLQFCEKHNLKPKLYVKKDKDHKYTREEIVKEIIEGG